MRDPFSEPASKQLYREAQIGLTVLSCLVLLFCYLAIKRFSGEPGRLPEAVRNAPLARVVQPDGSPQGYSEFRDPVFDSESQTALNEPTSFHPQDSESASAAVDKRLSSPDSGTSVRLTAAEQTVAPPQPEKSPAEAMIQIPDIELPTIVQFPESRPNDQAPEADNAADLKVRAESSDETPESNLAADTDPASIDEPDSGNGFAIVPTTPATDRATSKLTAASEAQNGALETDQKPESSNLNGNAFDPSASNDRISASPSTNASTGSSFALSEAAMKAFSQNDACDPQGVPRMSAPHPISASPTTTEPVSVIAPLVNADREKAIGEESNEAQPGSPRQKTLPEPDRHTTDAGESFFTIAQQYYDDGRFFKALYKYNLMQGHVPFDLQPGIELKIPTRGALQKQFSNLCPLVEVEDQASDSRQRLYLTEGGETLFGIARDQLGQASRFDELIQMNELRLPPNVGVNTPLQAGLKLVLPRMN